MAEETKKPEGNPPNPANPPAGDPPAGDPPKTPEPTTTTKAPDKYDLKLAEGSALDKADIDKIAANARTQGLSNEQAQALLKEHETMASGLVTRQQAVHAELTEKWKSDVQADKELGGENWNKTLANIKRAMDRFAPEGSAFRGLLNETGYGNHPEFVRFVNAIGRAMAEDGPTPGVGGGKPAQKTAAEVLYGSK